MQTYKIWLDLCPSVFIPNLCPWYSSFRYMKYNKIKARQHTYYYMYTQYLNPTYILYLMIKKSLCSCITISIVRYYVLCVRLKLKCTNGGFT